MAEVVSWNHFFGLAIFTVMYPWPICNKTLLRLTESMLNNIPKPKWEKVNFQDTWCMGKMPRIEEPLRHWSEIGRDSCCSSRLGVTAYTISMQVINVCLFINAMLLELMCFTVSQLKLFCHIGLDNSLLWGVVFVNCRMFTLLSVPGGREYIHIQTYINTYICNICMCVYTPLLDIFWFIYKC